MDRLVYTKDYYNDINAGSLQSARLTIPVVQQFITPHSVADIGCGTGNWLSVWSEKGVTDICGIDGPYIDRRLLQIERSKFITADLEKDVRLPRKYDLVMSLEVAEHIHPASAPVFVRSLCELGDVVLFSAAIPGQGGVHHVNEQYPNYWAAIFKTCGFTAYDCIRERIWMEQGIDACYRQNLLFFVRDEAKTAYPAITGNGRLLLPLVHPDHFEKLQRDLVSYKRVLRTPLHSSWYFFKKFFSLFRSKQKHGN